GRHRDQARDDDDHDEVGNKWKGPRGNAGPFSLAYSSKSVSEAPMNEETTSLRRPAPSELDMRHGTMLARNTLAVVLAGGRGTRLHNLTERAPRPSGPFGGTSTHNQL